MVDRFTPTNEIAYHPNVVIQEAKRQCEKSFKGWNLEVKFEEVSSQSELVGFDGGITAILSCISPDASTPSSVLFMSYENLLAEHISKAYFGNQSPLTGQKTDLYDCLGETSNELGGHLIAELEKRKIRMNLSLPTIFVGKAYLANFNRLFITNKLVGQTAKGRFELQFLITQLPE